jgi:hypothetical protein
MRSSAGRRWRDVAPIDQDRRRPGEPAADRLLVAGDLDLLVAGDLDQPYLGLLEPEIPSAAPRSPSARSVDGQPSHKRTSMSGAYVIT